MNDELKLPSVFDGLNSDDYPPETEAPVYCTRSFCDRQQLALKLALKETERDKPNHENIRFLCHAYHVGGAFEYFRENPSKYEP